MTFTATLWNGETMNLSMPTLVVTIVSSSAVLALSLAVVAFRRSRTLWIWAWALAAHTLAFILIAVRAQVGDFVTIVGGNVLLAATFSLFAAGLADFRLGRPPHWLAWAPIPIAAVGAIHWLDDTTGRAVFGSLVSLAQCLYILIKLIGQHRTTAGRGQYLLMAGFLLLVLVIGLRIVEVASGRGVALSSLESVPLQAATFLASLVTLMLLAAGITLMIQERTDDELARSREALREQNLVLQDNAAELEAANRKLSDLAITDSMTGLANRRRFDEALVTEGARARRTGQPLAILMIDIDWFKKYNDHYGHPAGDVCLTRVAGALQGNARRRGSDLVARYGGEEFTVITADTDPDQAARLAEALCHSVAALAIPHALSPYEKITISIGVAAEVPGQERGVEALLKRADAALYQAKEAGRNRVAAG